MANTFEKLNWSALEYKEKVQGTDWFWALGVVVVATAITTIIFGNYFFAILIILGGLLLGYFTIKKPELVYYELNNKGLKVKDRVFLFEDIKHFWVQAYTSTDQATHIETEPTLFIHTARLFMPVMSVPIDEHLASHIRSIMLSNSVEEKEMKEHPSVKIMETLGF